MAQVMRERDGFGEILVQPQGARDVPRNARDLDGVGEPRAQMVAGAVEKNLCLVFQPAEGARMNDAVAVALEMRAPLGRLFLVFAPARLGAELRVRREELPLAGFEFEAGGGHQECAPGFFFFPELLMDVT